ncbi:MAG: hypothetical protein ABL931_16760, partial [Usitatibacteraceae bacterium]
MLPVASAHIKLPPGLVIDLAHLSKARVKLRRQNYSDRMTRLSPQLTLIAKCHSDRVSDPISASDNAA